MSFRVVVGMDKFKGTLSSGEASALVGKSFRGVFGDWATVDTVGLADGGEGTCQALTESRRGSYRKVVVRDPLGRPVEAWYGHAGDCAFMEMASSSGLVLLGEEERNPLRTSTYGFGEMIADAIGHGAHEIILGLGGSGTNDGGAGMAEALGAVFRDRSGSVMTGLCGGRLQDIGSADLSALRERLGGVRFRVASDVRNPLLGRCGASAVYGPQKGATPEMVGILDAGLRQFRSVVEPDGTGDGRPGDGAAGGLGFGCRVFCGGVFQSGARLVMEESGFCSLIAGGGIDLVVTGEGRTDEQTCSGKLCGEVSRLAHEYGVPCVLLSGGLGCGRGELLKEYDGVFMAGVGRGDLPAVLSHAAEDLESAAVAVARMIALGHGRRLCQVVRKP